MWVDDANTRGQRIEPIGWDKDDRTYFVLDDNRVYRMTDPPPKPTTPKKKSKTAKYGSRSNKRRRVSGANGSDGTDQSINESADASASTPDDDGLGGIKWECLAVSLEEVQGLIASFHRTKDDNEKILRDQLQDHLLPILEKQEDSRRRKEQQREKELLNLAKMATAKRSSRIANKAEQQKQEEKTKEEDRIVHAQRAAARKEEQQRLKLEKERDSRLLSREKRLKEREARRLQHERELSQLSEDNRSGSGRISERRLQAEIERNKRALEELDDEEDDWIFDCICGVYGQVDDGTHSVACEKCNVWQHSKCLGISETEAEKAEFHFICQPCKGRQADATAKPKTTIKLKVNRTADTSSSPTNQPAEKNSSRPSSSGLLVETPSIMPATGQVLVSNNQHVTADVALPTGQRGSTRQAEASVRSPKTLTETHTDTTSVAGHSGLLGRANGTHSAKKSSPGPTTPKGQNDEADARSRYLSNGKPFANSNDTLPASPTRARATPGPWDTTSPRPGNSSLMATPIISREHGIPGSAHSSFTLPAPEGGLSPTKHSPPAPRPQPPSVKTPALPAVLPPVATLSPSPRQQILTPPIKLAEPIRRPQPSGVNPGAI